MPALEHVGSNAVIVRPGTACLSLSLSCRITLRVTHSLSTLF